MMRLAIGSDHAGYEMKQHLIERLREADYDVTDCGTHSTESVDYPDYAAAVGAAAVGAERVHLLLEEHLAVHAALHLGELI